MREHEIGELSCSLAHGISVIGDAWTLLLLRELFLGSRRFEQFQAQTGMAPRLLSERIKRLLEAQIIVRHPYQQRPQRFEYRLSDKGLELYPVIVALSRWGSRWADKPQQAESVQLQHIPCGQACEPVLVCSACHAPLHAREVRVTLSPALAEQRRQRQQAFMQRVRVNKPEQESK